MSDKVICLSDSDEEIEKNSFNNLKDIINQADNNESFDFPAVNFCYNSVKESRSFIDSSKKTDCVVDNLNILSPGSLDFSDSKSTTNNDESEVSLLSDNTVKRNVKSHDSEASKINGKQSRAKKTQRTKNLFYEDAEKNTAKEQSAIDRPIKALEKKRTKNLFYDDAEKNLAKEQSAIDRRIKALEKKNRKNIQPGECMKFIQVSLDKELEERRFYAGIVDVLRNYEVSYESKSLPISNSITWMRRVENYYVDGSNEIRERTENQKEKEIVVIWKSDETVRKIEDQSFGSAVANIVSLFENQRLTLVIYGMEEYFERIKKSKKSSSAKNNGAKRRNETEDLPKISRYDFEYSLAEIQLTLGCNSVLVETDQELAMLVYRFTKAIAEIPLKMEKRQKLAEKIDWYAMGDNKDTVKVDKNGIGLKRLWQQQLCQFNLASLETAEAVCSVYHSPRDLMQAYSKCMPQEGEELLKDIPIRRAAGPLSTVRKIGPELSKKIFVMFTSKDGEEILGNDRDS